MYFSHVAVIILSRFGKQNGKTNGSVTCEEGGLTEYPGLINKQKLITNLVLPLGLNRKEGIQTTIQTITD